MITNHTMRIQFISIVCITLLAGFSISLIANEQAVDQVDKIVKNLIESDFKSLHVVRGDSLTVKLLIKKAKLFLNNRNDSALNFADLAIVKASNAALVPEVSVALQKKGEFYVTKEKFFEATTCFIDAIKIEEKLDNEKRIAELNDILGRIYYDQEIFKKAMEYNEKALSLYQKLKDTSGIAKSLNHIGMAHLAREFCDKRTPEQFLADKQTGIDFLRPSIELCEKTGNLEGVANGNINVGSAYNRMGKPEIALGYVGKALDFYKGKNDNKNVAGTLYSLGFIYNRLQKYEIALRCFLEAGQINLNENNKAGIQFLYEAIAQTYDNLKDYKNSRDYYVRYMTLRDSIYNNEKSKQIFELETRYQTEKKQGEIERLMLVKQQRTLVIYLLIASLFLLCLFGWMAIRNIRNKKTIADQKLELKEQQLLDLEKERQLIAARSVLQGEESERSRLAGDLHDGLGGLLTGVKLKLFSMKENAIITSENLVHFNHALDLLDTSIAEMRRVAHNLMPETLMHYGLSTALTDFIKQVEPDELPVIRFRIFGEVIRYSKELEITLYRISQELINNSVKHACAKLIDIQLFAEPNRVCIQIIDDGIGFDQVKLEQMGSGKGLKNIRDRITAFNGRFEILSEPGQGTETIIEFLIT